jgi:ABC-type branched-subunit amino acid transport system ATPase component
VLSKSAIIKILYAFIVSCNEVYCILLQINGLEKKSIYLPQYQFDNLTHDDALELALSQTDLQKYTSSCRIVNTAFTLHPSYKAVINIKTERISKANQQQLQEG